MHIYSTIVDKYIRAYAFFSSVRTCQHRRLLFLLHQFWTFRRLIEIMLSHSGLPAVARWLTPLSLMHNSWTANINACMYHLFAPFGFDASKWSSSVHSEFAYKCDERQECLREGLVCKFRPTRQIIGGFRLCALKQCGGTDINIFTYRVSHLLLKNGRQGHVLDEHFT